MPPNNTVQNFDQLPDSAYIRQADLVKILPISAATLWRKVKDGSFPAPVKLSGRITAWNVGGVRSWMLSFSDLKGER